MGEGQMTDIAGNQSIRDLWTDCVRLRPNNVFLRYQDSAGNRAVYTYARFFGKINQTANMLMDLGVKPGECVAMQCDNCAEFIMVQFACAQIDAIFVPLNAQQTLLESIYMIEKTQAKVMITNRDFLEYYHGEGSYHMDTLIFLGDLHVPGALNFCDEIAGYAKVLNEERLIDPLDTCEILFTSGTTSDPKGVEITHANLVYGAYMGAWEFSLRSDDVFLTTMPVFHSNFQLSALMPVLVAGAQLVLIQKYSARRFWVQVRDYAATVIQMVSMMVRTMMLQPEDPCEREHYVREVQYYLPISDQEKIDFEQRFNVRLLNCYGSTESISWVLTDLPVGPRNWPSVGRPALGYEVKIADEQGNTCPPGQVGEILVHGQAGRTLMKGYYHDPENTAAAISPDGWLSTGDKGYMDESGWFYFVDRKSNMIKRAGENISASEVENVLREIPQVAEAAVIGVPDPIRDQAVKAFIQLEEGCQITSDQVVAFCESRLATFKVPSIIVFVDEFPKTSVGKIAKKLLS